ncbi:50S ribosomal protein L30e [Candidatus Bathyarchaeota archaeon]|nr:50S ribosomal protein L30e [Candidatus Bathyarchaeota archaeon]
MDVNREIEKAVKTGRVFFGCDSAVKNALEGKAKLIILAENCPEKMRRKIERYSKLSNIPILIYNGSGRELGKVCGKPFTVSALSIREFGDSKIIEALEG